MQSLATCHLCYDEISQRVVEIKKRAGQANTEMNT